MNDPTTRAPAGRAARPRLPLPLSGFILSVLLCAGFPAAQGVVEGAAPNCAAACGAQDARYPYGSPAFAQFVRDSEREAPEPGVSEFTRWWEDRYAANDKAQLGGQRGPSWQSALGARRKELAAVRGEKRVALERDTAAWLHRAVKAIIPNFSLERGFEFTSTAARGERQCLLQSVLIAGALQNLGLSAGVVMVWRNEKGQESNLGHAVTLLRLSSGEDLLVDASDPQPFMRHSGLLLRDQAGGEHFLTPHYTGTSSIDGYRAEGGGAQAVSGVAPLSTAFLRSQFYYYRGERAPGGFLGKPPTAQGLAASARFLERAQALDPHNPLAVYVLGHVYRRQGRLSEARAQFRKGYALYLQDGHVPDGPKAAFAWAQGAGENATNR